jgi:hypothetical protein
MIIDKLKDGLTYLFFNSKLGLSAIMVGGIVLLISVFINIPEPITVTVKSIVVLGILQTMFSALAINTGTHIRRD